MEGLVLVKPRERELLMIFPPRHPDLLTHGLPQTYKVASAKVKTESLSSPHITLYNSSCFKGILTPHFIIVIIVIFAADDARCQNGERNGHTEGGWRSSEEQRLR